MSLNGSVRRGWCLALIICGAGLVWTVAKAQTKNEASDTPKASVKANENARSVSILEQAEKQSQRLSTRLPELGSANSPSPIDPAVIAKKYRGEPTNDEPSLLVLVSFSLPKESLERIALQASKSGAFLVFRGTVDNSLKKTADVVAAFVEKYPGLQVQIDPTVYKRYAVAHVPTYILAKKSEDKTACSKACDISESFLSVAGDVTLDYALEQFSQSDNKVLAKVAERRLKNFRGQL